MDAAIAVEVSLKLKEITYIHSESYPAGELKHGSIALIDKNVLTIAVALDPKLYEKTLSNVQKVKARKGPVLIVDDSSKEIDHSLDDYIVVPKVDALLYPFVGIVPLQLLAYEICIQKGFDVDYPVILQNLLL